MATLQLTRSYRSEVAKGTHNFSVAGLKLALVSAIAVASDLLTVLGTSMTELATANGYTAGGVAVTPSVVDALACTADSSTDTITATGHPFQVATDQVAFDCGAGGSMPGGLTARTIYYVIATGLTANTMKVSATSGGSAIDITSNGSGVFICPYISIPDGVWTQTAGQTLSTPIGEVIYNTNASNKVIGYIDFGGAQTSGGTGGGSLTTDHPRATIWL